MQNSVIPKRFKIHRIGVLNKYENFKVKVETIHNVDDFNWEEHVYSILLKYLPNFAECLNSESVFAFQMTKR